MLVEWRSQAPCAKYLLLRERRDHLQIFKKHCQSNVGETGIHFVMLYVKCLSDVRKSLDVW